MNGGGGGRACAKPRYRVACGCVQVKGTLRSQDARLLREAAESGNAEMWENVVKTWREDLTTEQVQSYKKSNKLFYSHLFVFFMGVLLISAPRTGRW